MEFKFGNVALSAWKGVCVCSQIDEKKEDVDKLAIYEDHGDDFVIVKTKDGKVYEYGYFKNLKFPPTIFVREPVLFRKEDSRATISNKIFFCIHGDHGMRFVDRMSYRINKDSETIANYKFHSLVRDMQGIYDSGVMYHHDGDKEIIKRYLKENGIDTEENTKLLEKMVFDTSYYGIDGIAGKIEIGDFKWIYGDRLKYAYSNGKRVWLTRHYSGSDEYGSKSYRWKF